VPGRQCVDRTFRPYRQPSLWVFCVPKKIACNMPEFDGTRRQVYDFLAEQSRPVAHDVQQEPCLRISPIPEIHQPITQSPTRP